ncbi:MAG: hypothetical protein ACP5PK_07470 [candidate division WOR-3 bacterium]
MVVLRAGQGDGRGDGQDGGGRGCQDWGSEVGFVRGEEDGKERGSCQSQEGGG